MLFLLWRMSQSQGVDTPFSRRAHAQGIPMSDAKPYPKNFRFRSFYLILRWVVFLAGCLPRRLCLALGRGLGHLGFALMKSRAQVAMENLSLVYGERLTHAQKRKIASGNFAHLGAVFFECFHYLAHVKRISRYLTVTGEEHLKAALAQGRGAVLFSAHMGNFLLMTVGVGWVSNAKFIFREPSDSDLVALYRWIRERGGAVTIADNPRHRCAYYANAHLRAGGVLGVLIDQVENGGVYVDFMGNKAGSTVGAAKLALISGAPLVPMHCERRPDSTLEVVFGPEYAIPRDRPDDPACLAEIVGGMNAEVGKWVYQNPEQWFWGHRRWRQWRK
jgi:KDO2-lipid IV(A) lauroyltransferase